MSASPGSRCSANSETEGFQVRKAAKRRVSCLKLFQLLSEHAVALANLCQHALEILEALRERFTVIHT